MRYIDVTRNGEVQYDNEADKYILWNETYSDSVGEYDSIKEVLEAFEEYDNSLG